MDKEAQEKIVTFLGVAQQIGKDGGWLDIWGSAQTLLNQLNELGYRKLPKDKPPLAINKEFWMNNKERDIWRIGAKAQREADIKWYEGG